jgi:hypothetical protein
MPKREAETRRHLVEIALQPPQLVVLDGAVLATDVGGMTSYFEADEVAIGIGGEILIGENKSWPVVDGRPTDDDALGAALDQAATYVLLTRRTLEAEGCDPSIVSGRAAVVTPKNTGLQPTLHHEDIEGRVRRIARLLDSVPSVDDVAVTVPDGLTFASVIDKDRPEGERLASFEEIADHVGRDYEPGACLASCGFAWACRQHAYAKSETSLLGANAVHALGGVHRLPRVADLGAGDSPVGDETLVAPMLERAGRLFDAAVAAPTRRKRPA